MKTVFAASALAMVGCTEAFVTPSAPRAALSPSNSLDTSRGTTAVRAAPSMEFAGGLRGADGPEPNSKNFDPLGFAEARPENLLFFREAEIKVCTRIMIMIRAFMIELLGLFKQVVFSLLSQLWGACAVQGTPWYV